MAFAKFQLVPVDEEMKGVLYNLALDFERKRQFNKAAVVYEHIAKADPNFKDIKERAKSMKQAGETMIAGPGLGGGKEGGTIAIAGGAAKPTLGRYEIQKELGRGAMGVVYLGKDPKINRSVAIKTLRFDDDMDAETAKFTKERFFREAESAGTLNHPHIIRIFDAGEDNEISFIAMELLEGEDLKKYVEKDHLLPVPQVLEYVAQIADALDYAHQNGVVHRDVKPANIMRLKDGSLRVTDFGIARITASSKTATGTVMGTPSYMSPEQLSGKKVDGRSDLFSLGVMLYEMLTGEKPFEGDSIATLLFKIANEAHPDPRQKRVDRVAAGVKAVIDKALQKDPDRRYQRGSEIARDLRECLARPDDVPAALRVETVKAAAPVVEPTVQIPPPVDSGA
ncbi:MAG TPA: serine/threonine-protein kinase, partial [Elusimicrobiota bacterium]|nr:serine/threonine-protein kinase [Elusimicrobiota bacterium]